jgi:methylthioribose-1-phosphate isomerase
LQLALACSKFRVPFYIAAPFTTVDTGTPSGRQIEIEERPATEVTRIGSKSIAASGVKVYNPVFDLVDAELISSFITDRGVIWPPYEFTSD